MKKIEVVKSDCHSTKRCPHCGKDTGMTYWETGKCPYCRGEIKVGY